MQWRVKKEPYSSIRHLDNLAKAIWLLDKKFTYLPTSLRFFGFIQRFVPMHSTVSSLTWRFTDDMWFFILNFCAVINGQMLHRLHWKYVPISSSCDSRKNWSALGHQSRYITLVYCIYYIPILVDFFSKFFSFVEFVRHT